MDNIPEIEQSSEPRRGVAPFEPWYDLQAKDDGDYVNMESKKISLGDLGDLTLTLQQPSKGNEDVIETIEDDQAFTIDLSGNIHKGNLLNFLAQGYYMLQLELDSKIKPVPEEKAQLLKVDLWINNTKPTVSHELELFDPRTGIYIAFFDREIYPKKLTGSIHESERGIYEHFVLPNDPEILQAIRINVSSKQENPA